MPQWLGQDFLFKTQNILLYWYATVYLSIYLLIDIWANFTFYLLLEYRDLWLIIIYCHSILEYIATLRVI